MNNYVRLVGENGIRGFLNYIVLSEDKNKQAKGIKPNIKRPVQMDQSHFEK